MSQKINNDEGLMKIESLSNISKVSKNSLPQAPKKKIITEKFLTTKTIQNHHHSSQLVNSIKFQPIINNEEELKTHVKFESESNLIKHIRDISKKQSSSGEQKFDSFQFGGFLKNKTQKPKWKKIIENVLNSSPMLIVMSAITIFALFGTDFQLAFLPKKVDLTFNIFQILIMIIYLAEFVLNCVCKDDYIFSFYFWLDLISTISLFQDIDYIINPIMGYGPITTKGMKNLKKTERVSKAVSQVTSATRATRVLRVVRVARLFRMVKIYKNVYKAKALKEKKKIEEKKKLLERTERDSSEGSGSMTPKTPKNFQAANVNNNGTNGFLNVNNYSTGINNSDGINKVVKKLRIKRNSVFKGESSMNGLLYSTKERPSDGSSNMNTNYPFVFIDNVNKGKITNARTSPIQEMKQANLNSKIVQVSPSTNLNKDDTQKHHTHKKEKEIDELDKDELIKESRISRIITESLNQKVIVLVTLVLLVFPMLSEDFFSSDSQIVYSFVSELLVNNHMLNHEGSHGLECACLEPLIEPMVDSNFPIVNISYNQEVVFLNSTLKNYDYRYKEIQSVYSEDASIHIVFSIKKETTLRCALNLLQTIFVCISLTLASLSFEDDANSLVLEPLEIMIEIVEKVAKDPIGAKDVDELQTGIKAEVQKIQEKGKENEGEIESNLSSKKKKRNSQQYNYEIQVIKSAIIKISALLAIGFGEAGGEILKKNLSSNHELNPKLKGKKKTAIFLFCDIRNFNQINLALEERTMLLVNEIAEIVHSSVDRFRGATNKNIGESFLSVWKFYNEAATDKNKTIRRRDNLLEIDPLNSQVGITADCSVLSCLRIILKINKNVNILAYRKNPEILKRLPNFELTMGFGLHLGYGIEGTIGSFHKIEATYLSPNVNIAARLETATRQFGVSILISGVLYDKLTDELKSICRFIDCVKVKGSELPLNLYTIDLNYKLTPQKNTKILIVSNKEKRNVFAQKKANLATMIEEYGSVTPLILEKQSYKELIKKRNPNFIDTWNIGMENYKKGNWIEAKKCFEECLTMESDDGPAKTLLSFINKYNSIPPKTWEGIRELVSK